MMLDHLGEQQAAERVRTAIREVYAQGQVLTGDIRRAEGQAKAPASTTEFTQAVIAQMA